MEMPKFTPISCFILVRLTKKKEEKIKGTCLIKPHELSKKNLSDYQTGTVISLGDLAFSFYPDGKEIPVKVGDEVYFSKYSGRLITPDALLDVEADEEDVYRAIIDEDIIGIVQGNKECY